jgi:hypothetical protein
MRKNKNDKMEPLGARKLPIDLQSSPAFADNLIHPADKFRPAYIDALMRQAGYHPKCTPEVLLLATLLGETSGKRNLDKAQDFFSTKAFMLPSGLETLPDCWLASLPEILWAMRKPHWPYVPFFISEVGMEGGVLLIRFAQELPEVGITGWDWIRVRINSALYPSLWRKLNRQDALVLSSLLDPPARPAAPRTASCGAGLALDKNNLHGKERMTARP